MMLLTEPLDSTVSFQLRLASTLLLALTVASSTHSQADLKVPSQYKNLTVALKAAKPGDRILIAQNYSSPTAAGDLVIDKSVTIASAKRGTRVSITLNGNSGANINGRFLVKSLTKGKPLLLRDLQIFFHDNRFHPSGNTDIGFRANVNGEIRMANVSMSYSPSVNKRRTVANIRATKVWLSRCSFYGLSQKANNPCYDPAFWPSGGAALGITAKLLVMEDCHLQGGDAAYLWFYAQCNPPQTYGIGGTALLANTDASILTRCRFVEGNGSWFAPGKWSKLPTPSPGKSRFTKVGGTLIANDVLHTLGLAGKIGPNPRTHGPIAAVGATLAPLRAVSGITSHSSPSLPRHWRNRA